MLLIGDVHGQVKKYHDLIRRYKADHSIQVGDFGFGQHHRWHLFTMESGRHKVLFGNHDDTRFVDSPHSLKDVTINKKNKFMSIRGAYSIDKHLRTEGIDWWANEELNYVKWMDALDQYEELKPELMITHDCPHIVREQLFGIKDKSITSDGLQACFEIHQPRLWVFGHHHKSRNEVINGTRFICLAELEAFTL